MIQLDCRKTKWIKKRRKYFSISDNLQQYSKYEIHLYCMFVLHILNIKKIIFLKIELVFRQLCNDNTLNAIFYFFAEDTGIEGPKNILYILWKKYFCFRIEQICWACFHPNLSFLGQGKSFGRHFYRIRDIHCTLLTREIKSKQGVECENMTK
jgi:hypothetical protein